MTDKRMRFLIIGLTLSVAGCASEEAIEEDWADYVEAHNACTEASDCAVIYPGCPLGCEAAVSSSDVAAAEAEAQRLIDRYERGGRACAYGCIATGAVTCEMNRCTVGEPIEPTDDPCEGKVCGDECSTCTDNNCTARDEWCNADGECVADDVTCAVEQTCEDAGGTCTAIGDCDVLTGHIGDPGCASASELCCIPLGTCAGAEIRCTDGSSCSRPLCVDGAFECGAGFTEDTENSCGS